MSEMKQMRELEGESAKLKCMFSDVCLENQAMKGLFAKKVGGRRKKACVEGFVARRVCVVRAC